MCTMLFIPPIHLYMYIYLTWMNIYFLNSDTTYSPNLGFHFHNGRNVIQSEPDAVILSNKLTPEMEIESKVIAVVKVSCCKCHISLLLIVCYEIWVLLIVEGRTMVTCFLTFTLVHHFNWSLVESCLIGNHTETFFYISWGEKMVEYNYLNFVYWCRILVSCNNS